MRHTAHSTWKVSDSWCGTSSSPLGVECVAGTGDSEEKTLPMFRREVREIKSFFLVWEAVTADRRIKF